MQTIETILSAGNLTEACRQVIRNKGAAGVRIIMPQYEYMFSEYSYGFRPVRNTHQAIRKSMNYINSGYQHIVDIDLKGFFDEVDHCLLLQILYRKAVR